MKKLESEWVVGEPIRIVDFGNGKCGPDRQIPQHGDLERLLWNCAVQKARSGISLSVSYADYFINGIKQIGYFNIEFPCGSSGPFTFSTAWSYINGYAAGFINALKEQPFALCSVHESRVMSK